MLEQKQRQIWNLHEITHKVMKPNFLMIEDLPTEIFFFKNTDFFEL